MFAHLHVHTEYSLLDGACRLQPLLQRAKELGQTHMAITDHGNLFGVVDFYRAAKAQGITPVLGCEVYVAARSRFDKDKTLDAKRYHAVLLCENEQGYANLCTLVSRAWTEGFYSKPRVDHALLAECHAGLICLSGCLQGEVAQALLAGDAAEARRLARWYCDVFGPRNFFLEVQDHRLPEQQRLLPLLVQLGRALGIPLCATNDVHYIKREDSEVQQTLICMQTNRVLGEATGLDFETQEFYLKSEAEMQELFWLCPEAIAASGEIAARCQVEFTFGDTHQKLPKFALPPGTDSFGWLQSLCARGLQQRYGDAVCARHHERLRYELDVIAQMGFVDYFLIVQDFIAYAKSKDIPVGPGRGSGAGSLVAFCIGITDVDPLEYGLLFERFLNPERVTMPDFDIDFCCERRGEVIDYVIRTYGSDHVAQIITFDTLKARAALRDVGRAMGLPYAEVDALAKQVPRALDMTIAAALEQSPAMQALYDNHAHLRRLIAMARQVEGMPRHVGTHAAGVVITREPVARYVPMARSGDVLVTQFPKDTLEALGLLKMDFLGVSVLTEMHAAVQMVRRTQPDFCIEHIPLDDAATFAMIGEGHTLGLFQFESAGVRQVLMQLGPTCLEDLTAVTALYRPGPMDSIAKFVANRHHPERVRYAVPQLEPILRMTYGCLIYQEQVMQVLRALAGYSFGRADVVRRAMSKKKHDVMEQERNAFLAGCQSHGIAPQIANAIFDEIAGFASYAFNKSHAACYALLAYRTAYLKRHYPSAYMAALLSGKMDSYAKLAQYAGECQRLGLKLLPPHVNASGEKFLVEGNNVRFGLLAIKNLGAGWIARLLQERNTGGRFAGLGDLVRRMFDKEGLNRRAIEALIGAGALDGLGANRREMLLQLPLLLDQQEAHSRNHVAGQMGFFDFVPQPPTLAAGFAPQTEFAPEDLLALEKEALGFYVSGHPLQSLQPQAQRLGCAPIGELLACANETDPGPHHDNEDVQVLALIANVKTKTTKQNASMAFVTLEDPTGQMEALVFPRVLQQAAALCAKGQTVLVEGRLSLQENREPKLLCQSLQACSDALLPPKNQNADEPITLHFASATDPRLHKAQQWLAIFVAEDPQQGRALQFYFADEDRYAPQPPVEWNPVLEQELFRLLALANPGGDNAFVGHETKT